MNYDILIVGVGGQGTLLASRVLGKLADLTGRDCKLSEVHGMAQRGGSVVTHVRIAEKVCSPIITEGEADVVLSFELLEAMRWQHYLKDGGTLVVNNQEIYPMPVITGEVKYPENALDTLKKSSKIVSVNALEIAAKLGNVKTVNTIMLGKLAAIMGVEYSIMEKALLSVVPNKLQQINVEALKAGYNN